METPASVPLERNNGLEYCTLFYSSADQQATLNNFIPETAVCCLVLEGYVLIHTLSDPTSFSRSNFHKDAPYKFALCAPKSLAYTTDFWAVEFDLITLDLNPYSPAALQKHECMYELD